MAMMYTRKREDRPIPDLPAPAVALGPLTTAMLEFAAKTVPESESLVAYFAN